MNEQYQYKGKDEALYTYCREEKLDYLYTLSEQRNAKKRTSHCLKALRKLTAFLRSRLHPEGMEIKKELKDSKKSG